MARRWGFVVIVAWLAVGCGGAADPVPPHETFTLASQVLAETRVLNVWLPPGYAETEARFPVLYMPDGGVGEDFPHLANTVAELVAQGAAPSLLLVGIENTERRRDLTGPSEVPADAEIAPVTDGASRFRAFLADELFPEVARRYRVNDRRAIVGESAAGLFIVETLLLRPEMFDVSVAMDPALHWNDHFLVRHAPGLLAGLPARHLDLWFAGSAAPDIAPHTRALAAALSAAAPPTLTWQYSDEPGEQHRTIFRATKVKALRWALPRLLEGGAAGAAEPPAPAPGASG